MNKSLLLLVLLGLTTFVLTQGEDLEAIYAKATKCHESCNCDEKPKEGQTLEECSACNICTSCKHPEADVVKQSYCVCRTDKFRQARTSDGLWTCKEVEPFTPVPRCEWQLFNQIFNMVVVSNCYVTKNDKQENVIVNEITYDWLRVTHKIDDDCKDELKTTLLWAPKCGELESDYQALDPKYFTGSQGSTNTRFEASLMDVYQLANGDAEVTERSIYQVICLAVQLSNLDVVIRIHKFQLRIFTNRDQVQVFQLDVSKIITRGCDEGQQCIVVANLDTKGNICQNETCDSFKTKSPRPAYIVGDFLYLRIEFQDNTYTNYLNVITVKFNDIRGIYSYDKGQQWWQINQQKGLVDIKVKLWQPCVDCQVEVALKITLKAESSLRTLDAAAAEHTNKVVRENFQIEVLQAPTKNASLENNSNFSAQLFCGLILATLALLF